MSSLCYSLNEKEVLSPLLWLCTPLHEFLKEKNPFKTGKVISKEFVKWKQKGKWIHPFCELGLTEDQNVYRNLQRSRDSSRICRETETNLTKLEHFVNVHEITFKETSCKDRWEVGFCLFLHLKTGEYWALLIVLLMTEETGGSYKLVIYLSQNCLVICQSSVAEAGKTSLEADQKEEMRCESPFILWNQR